jgi:hypothetical protein
MPEPERPTPAPRRKLGRYQFSLRTLLILVAVIPPVFGGGVYLFSTAYGRGGRGFFSPDTFQFKTQSEILLPPTELPLYRSAFEYHEKPDLVAYLVAQGYWVPIQTEEPNWIAVFKWNTQWRDGEMQLYRYMNQPSEWIEWTEANPTVARVMWPKVLSILRRGITAGYAEDIMRKAKQSSSLKEFINSVNFDPVFQNKGISIQPESTNSARP